MVKRRLSDCEYIIFLMDVCPTTETASSNGNRPYKIGRMLSGDLKVEPLLCHILAGGMPGSLRRFPRGQWPFDFISMLAQESSPIDHAATQQGPFRPGQRAGPMSRFRCPGVRSFAVMGEGHLRFIFRERFSRRHLLPLGQPCRDNAGKAFAYYPDVPSRALFSLRPGASQDDMIRTSVATRPAAIQ